MTTNVPSPLFNMLSKGWNKTTSWFKYAATVGGGGPVFIHRNLISDMSRNIYKLNIQVLNPALHADALRAMSGFNPLPPYGRIEDEKYFLTNAVGEVASLKTIKNKFVETGQMTFDLQRWDLPQYFTKLTSQGGNTGLNPIRMYFKALEKHAVNVENYSKMLGFIGNWKSGMSFEKAAQEVHEHLYNYKLLPKAIQKSLGFVPFGRWTYLNTKGMVKRFIDAPGVQMGFIRAMSGAEQIIPQVLSATGISPTARSLTEKERKALPQFYQEDVAIPLYRMATGATGLLTSFDLPISELNEYGVFNGWSRTLRKFAGSRLHPILKAAAELAMGEDFFMQTPLEGSRVSAEGETQYPYRPQNVLYGLPGLKQLLGAQKSKKGKWEAEPGRVKKFELATGGILSRPMSEISKAIELPFGSQFLRSTTGMKIYEKNLADLKMQNFAKLTEQINELLSRQRFKEKKYPKEQQQ